ncbi:MAG: serine hydrolase domain-containing protein, partial [Actinomycetota bacterium]
TTTTTTTTTTAATTTVPVAAATDTTQVVVPASTSPPTTSPAPTTTASTTTTSATTTPASPPAFAATEAAFDSLANANRAASLTVLRDGQPVVARASGVTLDGNPARPDSPMVVASLSKLVTALVVARLDQRGALDIEAAVPWAELGIAVHPAWNDVTVRELLDHRSGMPVVRTSWFDGSGDCASFVPNILTGPPTDTRGTWRYSNGNYCALGLLAAQRGGAPLDELARQLLFEPLGLRGPHVTTDGQQPGDIGYPLGVGRLNRLGGAGTFIASTSDLAAALATMNTEDRLSLSWPGVMIDQYGWGHTGTVDGAKACAWTLEGGRTVAVAAISGNSPGSGGGVCDRIVPAVAADLGVPASGVPDRTPP